jgi:hypothetical protein
LGGCKQCKHAQAENQFTRRRVKSRTAFPYLISPSRLRGNPCGLIYSSHQSPKMSATPSSRRRGHSSRKSQSSTPIQQSQGTPRGSTSRQAGAAAATSSPLFYQSSSVKSTPAKASQRPNDGMVISSPPRQPSSVADRDATPKASRQPVGGESLNAMTMITLLIRNRLFSSPI